MRKCLKEPIPELFVAYEALARAVTAHLSSNTVSARRHFASANSPIVWEWLNTEWVSVTKHVLTKHPIGDTQQIPYAERDPDRVIAPAVRDEVLARDGYSCQYCGLPVVHADIRKIAHRLYPDEVPWNSRDARQQHSAFQAFWLQFDHVEPHSHGGRSTADNVVIACALCNFAKDRHTLRQLDLEDPRTRPIVRANFDGLEAFRTAAVSPAKSITIDRSIGTAPKPRPPGGAVAAFFFPDATISKGYVNIPPISGKSRWFKLGPDVAAELVERKGVPGCVVTCAMALMLRRGIDPAEFLDEPITCLRRNVP